MVPSKPTNIIGSLKSPSFDIGGMLDEVRRDSVITYRDPFPASNKTTRSQDLAWRFLKAREGHGAMIGMVGAKGSGKALANSERVLTPWGWVKNGEIRAGDHVVGSDGKPTRVFGVFPQGKRDIYRVTFNDGVTVDTDADHLWSVQTGSARHRGGGYKTLTTKQISADLLTAQGYGKWYVPNVDPVEFHSRPLPLAPYSLGALLGDGSFRNTHPRISSGDPEIVERVARETGTEAVFYSGYDYGLNNGGKLKETLQMLSLWGTDSHHKFIPEEYIFTSVANRIELLRGLMDTDGTVTSVGTGSFCTVSKQMAYQVAEIVRSLGGSTRVRKRKTNGGCGYAYRVRVSLPMNPFWLTRKADRYNTEATQGRARSIVSIEYSHQEEATCIKVEADDSLYVTSGYTVTHNTHWGSAFAFHQAQAFPESMGCIISNTYTQAKDNAGSLVMKMAQYLGFRTRFFQTKIVKGKPYTSLFVVDLDHKGFEEGKNSYILVRSFEAVNKLEGIELDWLWCEEIQDAREEDFVVVVTRVRGQNADNAIFIAGMPEDEAHWMYARLPKLGMTPEDTVRRSLSVPAFDPRDYEGMDRIPTEDSVSYETPEIRGLLFEPSIFENQHNLPPRYIDTMRASLDKELADRWIYGKRTAMSGNRVAHNFDSALHTRGRMSQVLCKYDPTLEIRVSVDFNVSPFCATLWQVKRWNDAWGEPGIIYDAEDDRVYRKLPPTAEDRRMQRSRMEPVEDGFYGLGLPNREILAQIDEFELWEGGTRKFVERLVAKYGPNGLGHAAGMRILGDSTGDRRQTSATHTDWQIISNGTMSIPDVVVTPGVNMTSNYKTGKVSYSNPPRRDTFNVLNAALLDSYGKVHVCFLPHSGLDSGGAAAAVQAASYKGDGIVDESNDKKGAEVKQARRTHFFDTVRYIVWDFRDGIAVESAFDLGGDSLSEVSFEASSWGSGNSFGTDWGGL